MLFDENGKLKEPGSLRTVGFSMRPLPRERRAADGSAMRAWRNENDGDIGGVDRHYDDGIDVNVIGRPLTLKDL